MQLHFIVLLLAAVVSAMPAWVAASPRPNIALILADDVGFSDFGAYGSEISTPTIDALAAAGVMFSNFHVSPICAPSRAMLLTGVDSHLAGVGNLPESTPLEHQGQPGYLGRLADDVVTVASLLHDAGYRTYMTGKWHLGHDPASLPNARGFERSFALDASGADNWEKRPYLPIYDDADWFEDGQPADLPDDFYSSRFLIDKAIEYIDSARTSDQPFFAYVAFQAVHIPVQAPRRFTSKYDGVYAAGWDELRAARFERVLTRGLLPAEMQMGAMPVGLHAWSDLSSEQQRLHAKSMAVYAGMLDAMDFHLGRLVAHLRDTGELDNTVFIVLSDNGPEPNDPTVHGGFERWLDWVGYRRDIATLGEKGTYAFIGPEFASAAAAPGAFFKMYAGEGGVRVPLIISGAGVPGRGMSAGFAFITDIAPTVLELAGVAHTPTWKGRAVAPLSGASLLPALNAPDAPIHGVSQAIAMEAAGNAALYKANYKLVRNMPPLGDAQWYLYDIALDPGETRALGDAIPGKKDELLADYRRYAERVGVREVPDGYQQAEQVTINMRHRLLSSTRLKAGLAIGGTVLLGAMAWFVRRRSHQARQ